MQFLCKYYHIQEIMYCSIFTGDYYGISLNNGNIQRLWGYLKNVGTQFKAKSKSHFHFEILQNEQIYPTVFDL